MDLKKNIPNIITLLNLFCGCVALIFVSNNQFLNAFLWVCLGIFFDFFDGLIARLLKVVSPIGLQLDSLADMVTSGLVPGFVMFKLLYQYSNQNELIPYFGFIITVGACYRLANFVTDLRQVNSFIGLPTPANSLFVMSLPMIIIKYDISFYYVQPILLIICVLSLCIMNSNIKLFSFKLNQRALASNKLKIIFLITSLILLILFKFLGIFFIILLYIITSILKNIWMKRNI